MLHFLVCDAYPADVRAAMENRGVTLAGTLYAGVLKHFEPSSGIDVLHISDPGSALPAGVALRQYDGIVWTGSSLTIYHDDDPRVQRNLELARAIRSAGLPSFGSCWAAQLAVTAAGGRCAANPKGREFGIARSIRLTEAGRTHPLFRNKPAVFDSFTSHADEIVELPPNARLLASNDFSRVQAVSLDDDRGFWGVQYHPEYELHDIARLCAYRMDELIRQGMFRDLAQGEEYVRKLETLHTDHGRMDLRADLGVGDDLLDPNTRIVEARNWIEYAVKPRSRY